MKSRTLIGVTLIFMSFALSGAGAFIIKSAIDEQNRIEVQKKRTDAQCLAHIRAIPNSKVTNTNAITVKVFPANNPMEALTTTSMAVMMCPNSELTSMCLGDKCDGNKPGSVSLVFSLTPTKE